MTKSTAHGSTDKYQELCIEALRRAGFRITKPRRAVIECIEAARKPLSAPEIFEQLAQAGGSRSAPLDKVSVYRILETLHSLHLVHRVPPSGSFIACTHLACEDVHHVITRCTVCDSVKEVDVPSEVVAPLLYHMEHSINFKPNAHLLQMDGRCKKCSKNNP